MKNSNKYTSRPTGRLTKTQAKTYGKVLAEIELKNGFVTKQLVLSHAENPKSPLHSYFEWNNSVAARKYREHQACQLITNVVWKVETKDEPVYMRSWNLVDIRDDNNVKRSVYINNDTVMKTPALAKQTVERIFNEYVSWRKQYFFYKEWTTARLKIIELEQKGGR